ncbi:MAG TPA: hypothetical protein VG537_04380 [Candidatus Kapabacteria bacterium]|nr:hypothetical protein [Candidatus Kapabacteria bacterium]
MLALHETLRIPDDHILRLSVPNIPKGEEVEVLVLSKNGDTHAGKIALIAEAARDPLYQQDMDEIADDFAFVDSEQGRHALNKKKLIN